MFNAALTKHMILKYEKYSIVILKSIRNFVLLLSRNLVISVCNVNLNFVAPQIHTWSAKG